MLIKLVVTSATSLLQLLSFPFCLGCMWHYDSWTHAACVYTACHGVYG